MTEIPLCIDAFGPKTMEAGVKACNNPVIMNSTNADPARMEKYFPLCREYNAEIICLCMDEKGIPNSADARAEMAMLMMATAMEYEIMPDRLFLDPLVMPVGAAQDQGAKVIQAVSMFQSLNEPAPRTVVGLSNVSNGAKNRSLLNTTYRQSWIQKTRSSWPHSKPVRFYSTARCTAMIFCALNGADRHLR